jgi:hypothetical protein
LKSSFFAATAAAAAAAVRQRLSTREGKEKAIAKQPPDKHDSWDSKHMQ